ncbi:MAG: mechanosensitive ion channel domain-containing protein [Elusimicrobiota bacterium]
MIKGLPLTLSFLVFAACWTAGFSHASPASSPPPAEENAAPRQEMRGNAPGMSAALAAGKQGLGEVRRSASRLSVKIVATAFLFALAWLTIYIGIYILDLLGERSARYRFLKKGIPVVRVLIWAAAAYIVFRWIFSPTRESFFAVMTASGVAIGFASQDILKNIFGGLVIILDRPFQVGDKIRIGEHYGEVVGIGLRTVRLVTSDDNLVTVPNAEIVNRTISNANSGELTCQVVTDILLPPDADLLAAKRIAWEAAVTSRYVNLAKPVAVLLQDCPSEKQLRTKLKIKAYVLDPRFEFAFSSDVTEIFKLAITAEAAPST